MIPTLCLCIYQRIHNSREILERLNNQTVKEPFQLFIWNNTGEYSNEFIKDRCFAGANFHVSVFGDGNNHGSQARFWLPIKDQNANPIICFDDDQIPEVEFVEYMIRKYRKRPNALQGWKARIFEDSYWKDSDSAKVNDEVDYIGTGGCVASREIFEDKNVTNIPEKFKMVEDLWLSYIARMVYGYQLIKIKRKLEKKKDNMDQHKIFGLKNVKEECFKDLRERGWILVKEK